MGKNDVCHWTNMSMNRINFNELNKIGVYDMSFAIEAKIYNQ